MTNSNRDGKTHPYWLIAATTSLRPKGGSITSTGTTVNADIASRGGRPVLPRDSFFRPHDSEGAVAARAHLPPSGSPGRFSAGSPTGESRSREWTNITLVTFASDSVPPRTSGGAPRTQYRVPGTQVRPGDAARLGVASDPERSPRSPLPGDRKGPGCGHSLSSGTVWYGGRNQGHLALDPLGGTLGAQGAGRVNSLPRARPASH